MQCRHNEEVIITRLPVTITTMIAMTDGAGGTISINIKNMPAIVTVITVTMITGEAVIVTPALR